MTDIDLWVIEPNGEKAFYSHNRTARGGLVSKDFTNGYGPEEYVIRKALHGKYKIMVDYYGSNRPEMAAPVTVYVEVYTNYGRPNEKRESLVLRLDNKKDEYTVGEIEY